MKIERIRPAGFIAILAAMLLQACGDYSIRLPGNYRLTRIYADALLINHPDRGISVDANVDRYKVIGDYVIGHVSAADLPPEKKHSKPGYFIVNTKLHSTRQGLDKKTWLDELRKLGIKEEPTLEKPSRFDRDYG